MSYSQVADNIYRDSRTRNFYERPKIRGRRTWRKLDGHNLKLAKESLSQRRADVTRSKLGLAQSPYAPKAVAIGEHLDNYAAAEFPDRSGHPRPKPEQVREEYRLNTLRPFWEKIVAVHPQDDCRRYFAWRQRNKKRENAHCGRAVDLELNTLCNALAYAVLSGKLLVNPLSERPHFRVMRSVKHCRDFAPCSAGELAALASHLFMEPRSESLGWQLLLEAFTGCRTSEVLRLRWDAAHGQAGNIEGDWLWLARSKNGVNPFAQIHPALRECLTALAAWRQTRKYAKDSPWMVPSFRNAGKPVTVGALTHALAKAGPLLLERKLTSHGLRSFFVTVRRSQGIGDGQIASEIGDKSGAAIIVSTYGAIPPNWAGRPGIGWLPDGKRPWSCIPGRIPSPRLDWPQQVLGNRRNAKQKCA